MVGVLDKLLNLENESSDFGFQWESAEQIMAQIRSECHEVEVHLKDGDSQKLQEEIGDLLHAIFSLCVFENFDPEITLAKSVDKYERRFKKVKELALESGLSTLQGQSFEKLMKFWDQSKLLVG